MRDYNLIRINFVGGLVAPGQMKNALAVLQNFGVQKVRFGQRQQLLASVPQNLTAACVVDLKELGLLPQVNENVCPNIISSYAGEEIFQQGNWCSEGIYKDIFDGFDFQPKLKVNISDNNQSLSPYFSGHLNFVASEVPNFWYLSLRLPKSNEVVAYKRLIFTNEIPKVCRILEAAIEANNEVDERSRTIDFDELFEFIPHNTIQQATDKPLKLHTFRLPYYEGLNRYGKKSWLGIYRRNEDFSIEFLNELCDVSLQTKVGQFCITPWKSLIVKGIEEKDRQFWSHLLTKHSISIRHDASELNWQIEDTAEDALELKRELVERFEHWDLRTFGICFGIKTKPKTEVFASIMITKRRAKLLNIIPLHSVYDISYTKDFDPNGRTKEYFATGVLGFNLAEQMRRSVIFYNKKLIENSIEKIDNQLITNRKEEVRTPKAVHQCAICFTVYAPTYGDVLNGIEAGIAFKDLPESYCCPTCEASKDEFVEVELNTLAKEF